MSAREKIERYFIEDIYDEDGTKVEIEDLEIERFIEEEVLNVYWFYENKKFTGKIIFENEGSETFISFSSDSNGQVIENGYVDNELAENIKGEIIANNYDMTDYDIF